MVVLVALVPGFGRGTRGVDGGVIGPGAEGRILVLTLVVVVLAPDGPRPRQLASPTLVGAGGHPDRVLDRGDGGAHQMTTLGARRRRCGDRHEGPEHEGQSPST